MSKVKVNKKVFEALESTKEWKVEESQRIELIMNYYSTKRFIGKRKILNELNLNLFLDILRKGYELELTPHEKIKKMFDENMLSNKGAYTSSVYSTGFLEGILSTLEALGEKVEGVNK